MEIHPPALHNYYVDDTMMMGSPTTKESLKIRSILQDFSDTSSTFINTKKSQIFFFNTPLAIHNHITCILGFSRSSLPSNYVGVPLVDNNLRGSNPGLYDP
jgi:hypothetical protein